MTTPESTELWYQQKIGFVELSERSLHQAAVREAGYIVVAAIHERLALGAQIVPAPTSDLKSGTMWMGQSLGLPEHIKMPEVGVAGAVADMLFDDPNITPYDVSNYIDYQIGPPGEAFTTLLPRELKIIGGTGSGERIFAACEKALGILREYRDFYDWVVEQLRDKKVLAPEEVTQYVDNHQAPTVPTLPRTKHSS